MATAKASTAKWPVKTPEETPVETPEETPEETPVETPEETPEETPVDIATEDPDTCYIEYREPITEQVNVPGVGPTAVTSHKIHRVPRDEWAAYEKALAEKKGL